jgi:hypothetical protein
VLDPSIPQFFAPGDGSRWTPSLLGAARIVYSDAKLGVDETRDIVVTTPIVDGPVPVDWDHAEPADFDVRELAREPVRPAPFDPLPSAASNPRKYGTWTKEFGRWVGHSQTIELLKNRRTRAVSKADESERDFQIRSQTALREERDREMKRVRDRYATRLATLDDRIRRAQAAVQREQEQATESKMQTGVSVAATIFGALLGRKAVSASTLGRATTAARGAGRIGRATQDVARAQAEVAALTAKRDELAQTVQRELDAIAAQWDAREEPLERVVVKPKRGGVSVQLVALVWLPR